MRARVLRVRTCGRSRRITVRVAVVQYAGRGRWRRGISGWRSGGIGPRTMTISHRGGVSSCSIGEYRTSRNPRPTQARQLVSDAPAPLTRPPNRVCQLSSSNTAPSRRMNERPRTNDITPRKKQPSTRAGGVDCGIGGVGCRVLTAAAHCVSGRVGRFGGRVRWVA